MTFADDVTANLHAPHAASGWAAVVQRADGETGAAGLARRRVSRGSVALARRAERRKQWVKVKVDYKVCQEKFDAQ